ncbi:MAG: MgtC/SapB family protein [Myxococcales bacterium]|nr:MgtC/SapB family protein [Myxococcales bacterium]
MLEQPLSLFEQLGLTTALGGLIGLQREHAGSPLGGVRTFPLIALFGAFSVHLEPNPDSAWLTMAGLVCIAALAIAGNWIFASHLQGDKSKHAGLTTEVAMLLTFFIGALVAKNEAIVAVVLAGVVAVLLQFKTELRNFAGKLDAYDVKAIMQFVLLSLVILPLVPNETMGPYNALNPHNVWLMVVLIVGIGLGGYVTYKFVGQRAGLLVNSLLGGLISTTATTGSPKKRNQPYHCVWAINSILGRGQWRKKARLPSSRPTST